MMSKKAAASRTVVELEATGHDDAAAQEETLPQAQLQNHAPNHAPRDDAAEICSNIALSTRIEAILISTDRPLTEGRIAEVLGLAGKGTSKSIIAAVEELNRTYEQTGRAFRAERLAGGWQILTQPSLGPILHRLHTQRQQSRLSQPALETLAIIAYRQPIMRAEIEAIRGVASGEVLRGLMERRLIKIVGRAEELGRPMLYGTTKEFLKVFGLSNLDDLPSVKGMTPPSTLNSTAAASSKTPPPESLSAESSTTAKTDDAETQQHSADAADE